MKVGCPEVTCNREIEVVLPPVLHKARKMKGKWRPMAVVTCNWFGMPGGRVRRAVGLEVGGDSRVRTRQGCFFPALSVGDSVGERQGISEGRLGQGLQCERGSKGRKPVPMGAGPLS